MLLRNKTTDVFGNRFGRSIPRKVIINNKRYRNQPGSNYQQVTISDKKLFKGTVFFQNKNIDCNCSMKIILLLLLKTGFKRICLTPFPLVLKYYRRLV